VEQGLNQQRSSKRDST